MNVRLLLPFAIIASGLSFPKMFRNDKPDWPEPEAYAWQEGRTLYHGLKNITTEVVRGDPQYWSKGLSFCILVALPIGFIIGAVLL